MNILDMMNKLTALSQPVTEAKKPSEGNAFDLKAKVTPEKEKAKSFVHKGKYGMEYQGDPDDEKLDDNGKKKKKAPKAADEKRGRGRPKKGADNAGNVTKPDWSAFGAKKDVKLPKWDKKATKKHSLKDWIENLDTALNEAEQVTIKPASATNTQVIQQGNKTLGTVNNPQLAQQIKQSIGKGEMTMAGNELGEDKNHMGETEYHGYYKWRVACRKAGATEFVGDRDIDEGHDINGKAVGEWDGVVGSVYGDAHKQRSVAAEGDAPPNDSLASPMSEAKKKSKPDFLDKDKDGNKKEPFKKAVKDAEKVEEAKQVEEGRRGREPSNSISAPTETGTKAVYKGTPEYAQEKKRKADQEKQQKNTIHNDKMAYRKTTAVEEGKDEGKPGKNFAKIAKSAGKEYGSKAAGERVAGAVRSKLAKQGKLEEGKVKELSMDLEDRTMKDAEFKKKYGKSKADMQKSMKPADAKKPASKIKESILRESHDTMKHIISKFKHEVKKFVAGGDLDEDLYDALYDYYCDMGEMPYGTMKARDGDPYEWVTQRFDSDVLDHDVPVDEAVNPVDIPAVTRKAQGVNFPATLSQVNQNDSLSYLPNVRKAAGLPPKTNPWDAAPAKDVQFESWAKDLDTLLSEGMNVVANTGLGDGPDSVTISATDEDAQKLLAIVKSAGLGMFSNDEQPGEEGSPQMSVQPQDGPEADIDVVDDHDGMLGLIRKMTGQGNAGGQQPGAVEVEVDEEETPDQREFQVAEEDEESGDSASDQASGDSLAASADQSGGAQDSGPEEPEAALEGEEAPDGDAKQATEKLEKVHAAWSAAGDGEEQADAEEEEKEEVDEAFANGADDTFESDIEYMQNVISGGVNGRKRNQSVGNPVTIASTPMKESTDLLKDFRKLSGIE